MHKFYAISLLFTVFCLAQLPGCVNDEPQLSGTPTPSSSPSPSPVPYQISITSEPLIQDDMTVNIENEGHYSNYLSIGSMRIYEYENSTLLDGICINTYPKPLIGQLAIKFFDGDRLCGEGTIYTLNGNSFSSGTNVIYSEIKTDISIKNIPFIIEVIDSFQPSSEDK